VNELDSILKAFSLQDQRSNEIHIPGFEPGGLEPQIQFQGWRFGLSKQPQQQA
jgi:hypothetical protein